MCRFLPKLTKNSNTCLTPNVLVKRGKLGLKTPFNNHLNYDCFPKFESSSKHAKEAKAVLALFN